MSWFWYRVDLWVDLMMVLSPIWILYILFCDGLGDPELEQELD